MNRRPPAQVDYVVSIRLKRTINGLTASNRLTFHKLFNHSKIFSVYLVFQGQIHTKDIDVCRKIECSAIC